MPRSSTRGTDVARFRREAEVLASLNHPNIATVFGREHTGGTTGLNMELGAASVLLGAAALAVLVPARRAARVDPAAILRQG